MNNHYKRHKDLKVEPTKVFVNCKTRDIADKLYIGYIERKGTNPIIDSQYLAKLAELDALGL